MSRSDSEQAQHETVWAAFWLPGHDRFDAVKKNGVESRVLRNTGRSANGQVARLVTPKRTEYPPKARDDRPFCPLS
ncbi:hypothetical protein NW766_001965 [Fusarium irregulare]|uniref:Uncharacterized protein n=1 Tax=Fusarium irregulare TaxID=2494466 RepID=A0A9W8PXT8_9HYPO|nr:hypothetical protein NW766_001965 [Fusarium irregulare]